MSANAEQSQTELTEQALQWLRDRLPQEWSIDPTSVAGQEHLAGRRFTVQAGGFIGRIIVEPRDALTPREATQLLGGFGEALWSDTGGTGLLIVAPWLSRRTQDLLAERGINYIDLTGNALVRLTSPAVYLESKGESRDPRRRPRPKAQLSGRKAGRLFRLLADVRPPYGVRELAGGAGLTPGYTSQLLDALFEEALVERGPRGRIEVVDYARLLRRWATTYDVLRSNAAQTFIAPAGVDDLLARLARDPESGKRIVVTGSFAAAKLAPVTAPALLLAYVDSPAPLAEDLRLLPATEGANVILLEPFDNVVRKRTSLTAGLRYAAPSQVVVDCLTGTGRMPAEGEALLAWMTAHESDWRLESLRELS